MNGYLALILNSSLPTYIRLMKLTIISLLVISLTYSSMIGLTTQIYPYNSYSSKTVTQVAQIYPVHLVSQISPSTYNRTLGSFYQVSTSQNSSAVAQSG
jgi:hypothetical protein